MSRCACSDQERHSAACLERQLAAANALVKESADWQLQHTLLADDYRQLQRDVEQQATQFAAAEADVERLRARTHELQERHDAEIKAERKRSAEDMQRCADLWRTTSAKFHRERDAAESARAALEAATGELIALVRQVARLPAEECGDGPDCEFGECMVLRAINRVLLARPAGGEVGR